MPYKLSLYATSPPNNYHAGQGKQGKKMKTWNEFDGSALFNRIFTNPIDISTIKLFQITIDNNRPNVTFEFDIPETPDAAPEKWIKAGFDTCRIGLSCNGVKELVLKNIPASEDLTMKIVKLDEYFLIRIENKSSLLELKTQYPLLCGPSVYMSTIEWPTVGH
ncbi:Imm50 family immunity protein [Pseudomonas chlororaphis]|uniref:Imm50 family immunity protein n=1 Tax=Pseudomonas chlororaphis TaxID=587753 RepID=UPI001EE3F236|nr:Imm50 family immunity protein [Pseudomonas chlororaphis]